MDIVGRLRQQGQQDGDQARREKIGFLKPNAAWGRVLYVIRMPAGSVLSAFVDDESMLTKMKKSISWL